MSHVKPQLTPAELVRALAALFDAVEPETPAEIDAALREAGHGPEAVAARMETFAKRELCKAFGLSPKLLGIDKEVTE